MDYYKTAPVIVEKINQAPGAKRIWKRLFWGFIVPFVEEVKKGDNEKAHVRYKQLIQRSKELVSNIEKAWGVK